VAEDARHDLIVGVHPDIAAADTGGYDAQQTRIGRNLGERNVAQFGRVTAV